MAKVFHYEGAAPAQAGADARYVMIGMPVFEKPFTCVMHSMIATADTLARSGIRYCTHILHGCCDVNDARNIIIRDFLETECTDLLFADADLRWSPRDVLKVLDLPGDIVAGVYPYKNDSGGYPFNPPTEGTHQNEHGLFEMPKAATGFMRIRREVLETLAEKERVTGRYNWQFGADGTGGFGREAVPRIVKRAFLDELDIGPEVDPGAGQNYHSGDYVLCLKARAAGYKVFVDPEIAFGHAGEKIWFGQFASQLREQQGIDHPAFAKAVSDLRDGAASIEVFRQLAATYTPPEWALTPEALETLWHTVREAEGDVLEAGSGLSSLVIALALEGTDRAVHVLEHDWLYHQRTESLLTRNRISGVHLYYAPLMPHGEAGLWYGVDPDDMPDGFGVAIVDGPPHAYGGRAGVLHLLGEKLKDAVLVIDDAYHDPVQALLGAVKERGYRLKVVECDRPFAIARPKSQIKAVAAE